MKKKNEEIDEKINSEMPDSDFGALLKKHFTKVPAVGETVKGIVISVKNGEVRLDIGGLTTGVVRGTELFSESKDFNNLTIGDEIEAVVLEQENERGEMELSFRSAGNIRVWDRLRTWQNAGTLLAAKIVQANKGGLMVQMEGIMGFMPVSQLNPDFYPRVPGGDKNKILEQLRLLIGRDVEVKVIDVDKENDKLIVSQKAVWEDAQKAVLSAYAIGDTVEGEVSALTSFGAFLKFGAGVEGLIHISEISWQRIDHPKDLLKIGQVVKAQIIDLNKSKIYLSLKRLVDDPWKHVKDVYKPGQVVTGTVHKVEPFGLMIKLDEAIHGLAHISELSDTALTAEQVKEKFVIGQDYQFEIVNLEPAEHRLGLKVAGVKGRAARAPKTEEKE